VTRGNEEGSCFLEKRPEQEDTRSSPSSLMELKFELDTRLTVSCVVAVASAYGLVSVSIAINSVLLAFGNAVILLLILFVLFGWRELLGELNKKRSTANYRIGRGLRTTTVLRFSEYSVCYCYFS
jgi:hypothetical protein